ncbi:BQ5605_C008g05309 [Microbotryum silenes-dioicae]|uniref:BQ5605_C008g05309 protein n=1 Tax=Microbotryum silenes-dioicae TaxID=796604 RepID=A0A2X0PEC6_9BASI|nr:BQ5605_C008g05309 [Microbotryum silenes-dioicae]
MAQIFKQIELEEHVVPGTVPQIRAFGVTQAGHFVLLHITGFMPYFWIAAPKGFVNDLCAPLMGHLNAMIPGDLNPVHSIKVAHKRSLWGYKGDGTVPFIKITISDLRAYPKVRGAFERGEVNFQELFTAEAVMTYESNIAYTLRFMIDHGVLRLPRPLRFCRIGSEGDSSGDEDHALHDGAHGTCTVTDLNSPSTAPTSFDSFDKEKESVLATLAERTFRDEYSPVGIGAPAYAIVFEGVRARESSP